jgi:hypothetical protein
MSAALAIRKGMSQSRDAVTAARELHAAIDQPGIQLAVFYCASDYDLPALGAELNRLFAGVNLIGCTSAGEITPAGYLNGALTGFSLALPEMVVRTQCIPLDNFSTEQTARSLDRTLRSIADAHGKPPSAQDTFAFLLIDGLAMQEELVVSTIHAQLQGISLIGGSAADDTRFRATHLFHEGRFHRNVALLSVVQSPLPFVVFRTQHFVQSEQRMVVTRATPEQRIVHEINGLPAGREFARLVGLQVKELTPLIFATHPVVVRIGGENFVRSIAKVNEDESLSFFCAIDEGIVLTIARGIDMVDNLRGAFAQVRAAIGAPQLVLGCDCILRRLETERDGTKEAIGRIFADNNVIGFATYGEQFNAMHVNQTFTGVAIGQQHG